MISYQDAMHKYGDAKAFMPHHLEHILCEWQTERINSLYVHPGIQVLGYLYINTPEWSPSNWKACLALTSVW